MHKTLIPTGLLLIAALVLTTCAPVQGQVGPATQGGVPTPIASGSPAPGAQPASGTQRLQRVTLRVAGFT